LSAGDFIEVSSADDEQPLPPRAKRCRKDKKSTGKVKQRRKRTHSMVASEKEEEPEKLPTRPECEEAQRKPKDGQRLKAASFLYPVCLCEDTESCEEVCPCQAA
jgi:hypothetical protein